jgi:hypothetical protein
MLYPNLAWAMSNRRLPNYRVAALAELSESSFSRALSGRRDFNPEERERIAKVLCFPLPWLFAKPRPPRSVSPSDDTTQPTAMDCEVGES